jgi:hypothetical protein
MTRVHALVLVVLLFTVVFHAALAGLLSRLSRRARKTKDPSQSPPGATGLGRHFRSTDRGSGSHRDVSGIASAKHRRGLAIYGACSGCGMPSALTHSTRR